MLQLHVEDANKRPLDDRAMLRGAQPCINQKFTIYLRTRLPSFKMKQMNAGRADVGVISVSSLRCTTAVLPILLLGADLVFPPPSGGQQPDFSAVEAFLTTLLKWLVITGLVSVLATVQSVAAQGPSVVGLWQKIDEETGKTVVWFLFIERGGAYEGIAAKLFPRPNDGPRSTICSRCSDDRKSFVPTSSTPS
jgi:hypothetical protein